MGDNFQYVIALHRPRVVKDAAPGGAVVDLLPIGHDDALAAGDAPDEGDLVLASSTGGARLSPRQGLRVGEPEPPV